MMKPAGCSGTPLRKKLGLKHGDRARILCAPSGFLDALELAPAERERLERGGAESAWSAGSAGSAGSENGPLDFAILFTRSAAELQERVAVLGKELAPAGMLWIAWPKRSSGVASDLDGSRVRDIGLEQGLVDVKVCAIDATWSGLKFVIRRKDR